MAKVPKLLFISLVFALLGGSALIGSLAYPWWGESYAENAYPGVNRGSKVAGLFIWDSSNYEVTSLYRLHSSSNVLFLCIAITMLLALVLAVVLCISILMFALNHIKYKDMMVTLTIILLLLVIASPIVFGIFWPMALKDDDMREARDSGDKYSEPDHADPTKSFWGRYEPGGDKYLWGPDIGWFLSFTSGLWFLISLIFLLVGKQASEKDDVKKATAEKKAAHEIKTAELEESSPASTKDPREMTDEELEEEIRRSEKHRAHERKGKREVQEF